MKNSKLLNLLNKYAKERIKIAKENNLILRPIGKKYLPKNTILRSYYNQAYFCFYTGMPDATVSLIFLILERLTRDVYNSVITNPRKENDIDWNDVLTELEQFFQNKKKESSAIKLIKWMKDKGRRNKHQHADIKTILGGYEFKAWNLDIKTGNINPLMLKANNKVIPKEIQCQTKHKITELTAVSLMAYLPIVIKIFYKYFKH